MRAVATVLTQLVVDALGMPDLDTGIPQVGEPMAVHLARREGRIGDDHDPEPAVRQPDRRLRDADIRLGADQDGRPPPGRLDRGQDRRFIRRGRRRLWAGSACRPAAVPRSTASVGPFAAASSSVTTIGTLERGRHAGEPGRDLARAGGVSGGRIGRAAQSPAGRR